MGNQMGAPVENVVAEITSELQATKLAVFVGAGISCRSGVPLATDLKEAILNVLGADKEDMAHLISSDFPFEAFMGVIQDSCTIRQLLHVFCLGQPNRNHILLARLVKKGYLHTIYTTNFDTLIEKALENEKLHRGKDYWVFHTDGDLAKLGTDVQGCSIIKLHGSIEDEKEVAITLEQVAGRIYSESRRNAIRHMLSDGNHEHVLILGYSCSDVFDISPQIEQIATVAAKKVTLVQHCDFSDNTKVSLRSTEHLSAQSSKNPFKHFSNGARVFFNTDVLVNAIWNQCVQDESFYEDTHIAPQEWKQAVNRWASTELCEHSHAVRFVTLGTMLFRLSLFEGAIKYFQKALDTARNEHNQPMEAVVLSRIGNTHRCMGHVQEAICSYEKALAIADTIDNTYGRGIEYHDFGVAYKNLGRFERAVNLLNKALKIAQQDNNMRETAGILGDIGNTYNRIGDYNRAIQYFKEAIQIAIEHGYKQAEGDALSGLGNSYIQLQDFQNAIHYYESAIKISTELGDQQGMGISWGNLGNAYAYFGELDRAIELHKKALDIARATKGTRQEAESLGNIGFTHILAGKYENAIEYLNNALPLFEQLSDKYAKANAFSNLAGAHWGLGHDKEGNAFAQQALLEFRVLVGSEHPRVKHIEMALRMRGSYPAE